MSLSRLSHFELTEVDGNAELATLRELGVRECGHEELSLCGPTPADVPVGQ